MKPFETVTSKIAPLDLPNVDTDQIIPKQFLKRVERTGFGQFLFYDWRFLADGSPNPEFVLNKPQHQGAAILLTRDNFGCGSSREHAPWALLDFGFRVLIAPSFADIFYNNCFQNGILPVVLDSPQVEILFQVVEAKPETLFTVDLNSQQISWENQNMAFALEQERKEKLLKGMDDISWTLQWEEAITHYEKSHKIF